MPARRDAAAPSRKPAYSAARRAAAARSLQRARRQRSGRD